MSTEGTTKPESVEEPKEVTVKLKQPKVEVLLQATGDAPILKQKKWQVESSKNVAWIISFLRKIFKTASSDSLFIYINQSFSPTPDRLIGDLYDCFQTNGTLILHYAKTPAWG